MADSVSCLDFDDSDANNFIDSVISSHNVNQSIKSLHLRICRPRDDSDFNVDQWVNVQSGLEHLHLEVELRYNCNIPVFQNLTELNLIFEKFSWQWMIELLKHVPKLQILVIDKTKVRVYDENWAYPQRVPECLSLHLKTCTVKHYYGLEGEFRFARYIMQNARVLQTMTIFTGWMDYDENLKILKKLSSCPRSSATCQLLFEE